MRKRRYIFVCVLSLLLSACMGGIEGGGSVPTLPAPTGLAATPGISQVILNWNAVDTSLNKASSASLEYEIFRDDVSIGTQSGTTVTDTGLVNGQAYSYKVRALRGEESSEATAAVTTTPMQPAAPTSQSGSYQVTLTWDAVPGAVKYLIYKAAGITPSLSPYVSKASSSASSDEECESIPDDQWVLVTDTTATNYTDTDITSNCEDVCYRVLPKNAQDGIMVEGIQAKIASPSVAGDVVLLYESGGGTYPDVVVADDDTILVTHYAQWDENYVRAFAYSESAESITEQWNLDVSALEGDEVGYGFDEIAGAFADGNYLYVTGEGPVWVDDPEGGWFIPGVRLCRVDLTTHELDASFGGGSGCVDYYEQQSSLTPAGYDIDQLSNGDIVVVGTADNDSGSVLMVFKYSAAGDTLDKIYSNTFVMFSFWSGIAADTLVIGGAERIVATGYENRFGDATLVSVLLDTAGNAVASQFDLLDLGGGDVGGAVLNSDDALLVSGSMGPTIRGLLASLDPADDLDLLDYVLLNTSGSETYSGNRIALDCRYRPAVPGVIGTAAADTRAGLWQMQEVDDSTDLPGLNTSFGDGGIVELTRQSASDEGTAVAFDSQGRYFLVGKRQVDFSDIPFIAVIE